MSLIANSLHRFEEFELDPARRLLLRCGTPVSVSPKAFEVLSYLVANPGRVVTKEELLRHKYPAELFDSAGNESAAFGHPPESQPPDWLGNNSSLWMDRQLLDAYGYFTPGITTMFLVGVFWKRATHAAALTAALLSIPLALAIE